MTPKRVARFRADVGPTRITNRNPGGKYADTFNFHTRSARADMRKIMQQYDRWVRHMEGVTPDILWNAFLPAFALSQVYCPFLTGKLRASYYYEIANYRGVPHLLMGYGRGKDVPYAALVHEKIDYEHDDPTRAQWLTAALREEEADIKARIVGGLIEASGVKSG